MAGEKNYLRVPPDSTGKRLKLRHSARIFYSGKDLSHVWQVDKTYLFSDKGFTFVVHDYYETTTTAGYLDVIYEDDARDGNLEPTPTIDYIRIVGNGANLALVTAAEDIYVNTTNIVGAHTENTLEVDYTGAANIRFSEGAPQLDAFGKLRVSQGTILGDYTFKSNILPYEFSTKLEGGTATHNDNLHSLVITTDKDVDPIRGYNVVLHTSNTYHHYFPGQGHTCILTVAIGDEGRDGVIRNWGLFDFENGMGFRTSNSTDGLQIFIRSNATGAVVDTVINQADFNVDKVDGTGNSGMNLRLTDDNIYWCDVQWLGAGRVRFGTYHRGQRVVMHEHYHEGALNAGKPNMATASLPVCYAQKVVSPQVSDPTMLAWCAAVHTEMTTDLVSQGSNSLETFTLKFNPASLTNGLEYELVGVLSPVKTLGDLNHTNHTLYLPQYMEVLAYHADGTEALVEVEVYVDPVLSGNTEAFSNDASDGGTPHLTPVEPTDPWCATEQYKASLGTATYYGGGLHALATYAKSYNRTNLTDMFDNIQNGAFKNYAENGGTRICNLSTVSAANPAVITFVHPEHREGNGLQIKGVTGTMSSVLNYSENGNAEIYIKYTGLTSAELYYDKLFQNPVDTTGLTYTGGGMIVGDYGVQQYFAVVVKPMPPTINYRNLNTGTLANGDVAGDVYVHFNLGWKEILQ